MQCMYLWNTISMPTCYEPKFGKRRLNTKYFVHKHINGPCIMLCESDGKFSLPPYPYNDLRSPFEHACCMLDDVYICTNAVYNVNQ